MSKKLNAASSPRYRLYPTARQKKQIDVTLDAVRFTYNYFLTEGKQQYAETGNFPRRFEMQGQLPGMKKGEYPWLKQADSVALQVAVLHLSQAFSDYNKRRFQGLPVKLRFKHKYEYEQSYRRESGGRHVVLLGDRVKISKLGFMKIRPSQPVSGRIIAGTITRVGFGEDARYYISFCHELPDTPLPPLPATGQAVGIDLGLGRENFAVTSDSEKFPMPDFYGAQREKLDKLYGKLRRQKQGSEAWKKTYNQVRRIYEKISNQRKDFFRKLALDLVRRYDIICIETLNTRDMIRRTPAMKHTIQSAAFGEFARIFECKCKKLGRKFVAIHPFFPSSQLCSTCGYQWTGTKNLKVRTWTCPVCHSVHDRDINAAVNILHEGLRQSEEENAA